jgi:predicted butyrate kinase (DUF1464 family)
MIRSVSLLVMFWVVSAHADLNCQVDLQYGLVVNDTQIRVIDESQTLYQINNNDQLIVGGQWLELDEFQQQKLKELSEGLHYVVPKMILLASEGVELAIETVEQVYLGLVGNEHDSYDKLQVAMERVKKKVKYKFIHANDNYYIGPGRLENVNDLVDRELEEQLEEAINTSLGGILSAIGRLASSEASTERKMEDLSQRLEVMGEEIEKQVAPKADSLKQKAIWFCNKFNSINAIEEELRDSVAALQPYNVILTDGEKHKEH